MKWQKDECAQIYNLWQRQRYIRWKSYKSFKLPSLYISYLFDVDLSWLFRHYLRKSAAKVKTAYRLPLGPTTMAAPRNPHDEGIVMYETHHPAPPQAPSAAHFSSSLSPSVYRWLRPINNSRNLVKG